MEPLSPPEPLSVAGGVGFVESSPDPLSVAGGVGFVDPSPDPLSVAGGVGFVETFDPLLLFPGFVLLPPPIGLVGSILSVS